MIVRNKPATGVVRVALEVPFHDADPLHIVWHGHYYKYLEIARTALMRSRKLDVPDFQELGFRMVLTESHCRHIASLRYGDSFFVDAWFVDYDNRLCIAYEILMATDNKRVALGSTTFVTTTSAGDMLFETPDVIRARIES